jgi:AcrR family transcriptional regulator
MAGLRERKKEQTRRLIAETARQLFSERGFEHVTIAEIAEAAEVAVQTVFNYFPTKEDLVYWRLASFEGELLAGGSRSASRASRHSRRSRRSCSPSRGCSAAPTSRRTRSCSASRA